MTIEQAIILSNENHAQTTATLQTLNDQLKALRIRESDGTTAYQGTHANMQKLVTRSIQENNTAQSNRVQITAFMARKCDGTCNCQCHARSQFRSPRWLSFVVGSLFYTSINSPALRAWPCNVSTCFRSQKVASSCLAYHFPSWMLHAALVCTSWSNLEGHNSSWVIKMPREISWGALCWKYIHDGNVEKVKCLLKNREMSPYDINPHGRSVLQASIIKRTQTS